MTPIQFVQSAGWKHRKQEALLEILAVCLPVIIYTVGLLINEYGLPELITREAGYPGIKYLFTIPDALFGGCVLFAFAIIQGFQHRAGETQLNVAHDAIVRWRLVSIGGLIVCSVLSGIAVMFKPWWGLIAGCLAIYLGGFAYKKIIFCKEYLRIEAHPRGGRDAASP